MMKLEKREIKEKKKGYCLDGLIKDTGKVCTGEIYQNH